MFKRLKRILTHYLCGKPSADQVSGTGDGGTMGTSLRKNVEYIRQKFGGSSDVVIRTFTIGSDRHENAALIFIEGITNGELLNIAILKPLMYDNRMVESFDGSAEFSIETVSKRLMADCNVQVSGDQGLLFAELLSGSALFFMDDNDQALILSTKSWDKRGIDEPSTETVVRGPRQGFTETLRTNTALLRRIIKNPDLRFETLRLGEKTGTDVCIAYIEGTVRPGLVDEIKRRLSDIQADCILESGYIEAFIEDAPHSLFSTINSTERPDSAARLLLEGRAAVLVDGTPFVLTMPFLFVDNFRSAEDYYIKAYFANALRVVRVLSYFISIAAPAFYVALTTFHHELIPTNLLFTMIAGRAGTPFPSLIEAVLMMLVFDILKEAGVRLPKPIGSAVSIVGALVVGEASVSAGLVGPFMVIVVAITAITSFAVPSQMNTSLIIRYFILLSAGLMGVYGIAMAMLLIVFHLLSIESFGADYLSSSPVPTSSMLNDSVLRLPLRSIISELDGKKSTRG